MRLVIISFILVLSIAASSQDESVSKLAIGAAIDYRNHILSQSQHHTEIEPLIERWESIDTNKVNIGNLLYNMSYSVYAFDMSLEKVRKNAKKYIRNSPLADQISQNDINVLKRNGELLSLVRDGFLSGDYPYPIMVDEFKLKEFEFIDIQPNETVADIGSGEGGHILIAALAYPDNDFILNELYYSLTALLKNKIEAHSDLFLNDGRTIEVVPGFKKNINLGKKVDKIIVRNSFHHFKKKKHMLQSIAESLNPGGQLVFIEPLKGNHKSFDGCRLKLEYSDVINQIRDSPFTIVQEEIFEETLFFVAELK